MQHNPHTGHGDRSHYLRLAGMIVVSFMSSVARSIRLTSFGGLL